MPDICDIAIIGGGISGLSLAARLSAHRSIALLEAEEHLGSHATGRSAALLVDAYGPPEIRLLTRMSRPFFEQPPAGFSVASLSGPRGALIYAGHDGLERLRSEFELARRTAEVVWLGGAELREACPLLRPEAGAAGFLEPGALDLDTNALLQGFARSAQHSGAAIHADAPVTAIARDGSGWRIRAGDMEIGCRLLVNAAGAWADRIAALAGAKPYGLQPMRRTAATVEVPIEIEALLPKLPFVTPVDETFYFKPEARAIMVSLADETPSDPCDAYPDDFDVALALDRFYAATTVPPVRPRAAWAGLRTFAPDRRPVVGFDPETPGFFWYAGQGGYGIQTSPALSVLASKLVLGTPLDGAEAGLEDALSPWRCRSA